MRINKPYRVSLVSGQPSFDSLPVAKITDYPLEKRDYKPFAQCILCVSGDRLHLRMWAFEVSPMPGSALVCVIYPYPDKPGCSVAIRLEHDGESAVAVGVRVMNGGEPASDHTLLGEMHEAVERHPHNGEDLQGVYWGMTVSLPLETVEQIGGKTAFTPGMSFPGNFYKLCEHERFAHQGSHFPARFPDDPFGPGSMGEFQVVSY